MVIFQRGPPATEIVSDLPAMKPDPPIHNTQGQLLYGLVIDWSEVVLRNTCKQDFGHVED